MAINSLHVPVQLSTTPQLIHGEDGNQAQLSISTANIGVGTATPSALLQVGEASADYFSGVTTLGITQRDTDTVGLSVRKRTAGNVIIQFCAPESSGTGNCAYMSYNPDTGTIGILTDGDGNNPKLSVSPNGVTGVDAIVPQGTPLSTDPGTPGQMKFDDSNLYVCTAANTWERTSLGSY